MAWGSNTAREQVGTTAPDHQCFYCDMIGPLPVYKSVERGHLFFIPTPFTRTEYTLYCPNCKGTYELTGEEGRALEQAPAPDDWDWERDAVPRDPDI